MASPWHCDHAHEKGTSCHSYRRPSSQLFELAVFFHPFRVNTLIPYEYQAAVRERALKKGGGEGEGEGEEELPAVGLAAGGAPATEAATPAEGESAPGGF